MKTYNVWFTDCKDGFWNHKILEAKSEADIKKYMQSLGHSNLTIELRRP